MHFHELVKSGVRYFVVFWIFRLVVHLFVHDIVQCANFVTLMIVKVFLHFCVATHTKLKPHCPVAN